MKRIIKLCVTVILLLLLIGCEADQFQPEWNEKFEKNSYGCRNETDAFYIENDGVYRMSNSERIIPTGKTPISVCANDHWVVCLVQGESTNNNAILYNTDTQESNIISRNVSYKEALLLTDNDVLLIIASESFQAYDLIESRYIELPKLWQTTFQNTALKYSIVVYQIANGKFCTIKRHDVMGSYYSVVTEYGSFAEERGLPVLETTENEAVLLSNWLSNDGSFSVFKVRATGACEELISIPENQDKGNSMQYQFGPCHHLQDGSHALTLRKMNGWHPAYIAREKMYIGDIICVFSKDWSSYRMVDLGEKKLIGSENGILFYLEDNILYCTTADRAIESDFDTVDHLPRKWKHIAFSGGGSFTVFR